MPNLFRSSAFLRRSVRHECAREGACVRVLVVCVCVSFPPTRIKMSPLLSDRRNRKKRKKERSYYTRNPSLETYPARKCDDQVVINLEQPEMPILFLAFSHPVPFRLHA